MPGDLLNHTLLGRYRIEAFSTLTPQGELYRAFDLQLGKMLGVTLCQPELSTDPEALKQLEVRAALLTKINHPVLLPSFGLELEGQSACLLEDWVDGPSLRDILLSHPGQSFSVQEALIYARALSSALGSLHAQGWVHSGICPERIHIDQRGSLRLSGLGSAKRSGEVDFLPSTHPYAAPEQAHPARLSPSTDLYALAAILFELVTGQPPRDELTNPRKLNPKIPDFFARVILQGLARRPQERFNSADEFFLSLCLAARLPAEAVAEKIGADSAPLSAAALGSWHYLPPPANLTSVPIPLRPLKAAQITASSPPPPHSTFDFTRLLRPALLLLLLGGLGYALWQIKPPSTAPVIPPRTTLLATNLPSPAPTLTLPPAPTEIHGGRIIFTCTRGDFNQLCMIKADGSQFQLLTNASANNYYPTFAPGGQMIVFASNRLGSFDLYLLILESGNLSQLTHDIGNVVSPSFSPEGQKIVFANRAAEGPTSIWVVDKDGLNPQLLYAGPNTIVATAWSPDGLTIAYAMAIDQPNEYQIFLMDADGTHQRQISQGLLGIGGSLDWSPDGKNLLIFAGPPGDKDIFQLDIATGSATQLTDGGNNTACSYSPDGQFIVFNSLRTNDQADLYIMNADGSNLRQLTKDPEPDWQPRWER
jgi:serine/threonine protein kinase